MEECVYLIGCRAVGKTSIGTALARRLGYEFLDSDALVVEKTGASIAIVVSEEGWAGFRKYERQVLSELSGRKRTVVATGGGAVLHREIWSRLKEEGRVVWLTADTDILCERLQKDARSKSQRPSLTGKDVCQELREVLIERRPYYQELADYTVDCSTLTLAQAVGSVEKVCRLAEKE